MLAHVVGAAEHDDLGLLARRDRQPRARGDGERGGIERTRRGRPGSTATGFAGGVGRDQERGQDAGDPRQLQRRGGFLGPVERLGDGTGP